MNPRNVLGAALITGAVVAVGALEARIPDCQHQTTTLTGTKTVDPGELNRFPASEAVGDECESVPCEVTAGEDPDGEILDAGANPSCVRRPSSGIEMLRRHPREVTP